MEIEYRRKNWKWSEKSNESEEKRDFESKSDRRRLFRIKWSGGDENWDKKRIKSERKEIDNIMKNEKNRFSDGRKIENDGDKIYYGYGEDWSENWRKMVKRYWEI